MKKFLIRTLSGAVYVMIVVGTIYASKLFCSEAGNARPLGSIVACAVLFILGMIGTHEIVSNLEKKGTVCNKRMTWLVSVLTYTIVYIQLTGFYYLDFWTTDLIYLLPVLWLSVFIVQLWRKDEHPFEVAGHTLLPSLWVMLPLAIMTEMQYSRPGFLMMIFILIWVNDSFAYMTGMILGKHKMWERHSPNKTWEGTIGGALFCIAAAIIVGPMFNIHAEGFGRLDWAIIGLLCSAIGTLGDLVESMFKRYCGVKDSGKIMPGHGGMLDRFDSILMAAPVAQVYIIMFYC